MTIAEVFEYIDEFHPNTVSQSLKLRWINEAEGYIQREVMLLRHAELERWYTQDNLNTVLLALPPYDEQYVAYLDAKLFYLYHEITDYENAMERYNKIATDYAGWYARMYAPARPEGRWHRVYGNYPSPPYDGGGGTDGVGIESISFARVDSEGGNVYTILLTNGDTYEFTAPKGSPGESAYDAAVEGGYTGAEAEFNADMANVPTISDFFVQNAMSANMFNKDDSGIIADQMLTSGGGQREQVGSSVTHLIPVVYGNSYTYPIDENFYGNNHTVQYFNEGESQCYDVQTDGTVSDGLLTFSATHTGFVRVNFTTRSLNDFMFCRADQYPESYEPYGGAKTISAPSLNPLYGKKISIDGDSIARGTGNNDVGFGEIIAARNNMVVENKASGGGTIVNVAGHHCIGTSAATLASNADYYIIDGGVNDVDVEYNIQAGTISDGYTATLDTTTFAGAFESMLKSLVTTFAGKKIGYIIPHYITPAFSDGSILDPPVTTFYDIAKRCCEKWGVPCLDLSQVVPTLAYIQSLKNTYTYNSDGWHPNEEGYMKYYCDKIEAWLKSL